MDWLLEKTLGRRKKKRMAEQEEFERATVEGSETNVNIFAVFDITPPFGLGFEFIIFLIIGGLLLSVWNKFGMLSFLLCFYYIFPATNIMRCAGCLQNILLTS
jgi:hypothetical protein